MPPLVMTSRDVTAHTVRYSTLETTLPAGTRLTIESSPAGEEFFGQVVPDGKQWVVTLNLVIVEAAT